MATTESSTRLKVVSDGHGFTAGQVLEVINGRPPAGLKAITTPHTGPAPGGNFRIVDAELFVQHTAPRRPRRPPAVETLSDAQVQAKFGWTPQQFEDARHHCGLPQNEMVIADAIDALGPSFRRIFRADLIETWAARVKSLGLS